MNKERKLFYWLVNKYGCFRIYIIVFEFFNKSIVFFEMIYIFVSIIIGSIDIKIFIFRIDI